ncbi:MAG: hypothetical protein U0169_16485 [Polyangiaceae bacterium]
MKTYLVANYSGQSVTWKKYKDGERVLVRERWDNPFGPNSDFTFATEAP